MHIPIINKSPHPMPHYETVAAAGMDLRAWLPKSITLAPQERQLIATGLYIALPNGYEAQIRPRSGLSYKHGLTVLNAPGTIDADYRGEIKVLLINLGQEAVEVKDGDRIAQMVIAPCEQIQWRPTDKLDTTQRGQGGYGSTGV